MRLILMCLVLVNVGVFVYFQLFIEEPRANEAPSNSASGSTADGLTLLSEVTENVPNGNNLQKDIYIDPKPTEKPLISAQPLCTLVGAFKKILQAEYFIEEIGALGLKAEIKNLIVESEPRYWLHLRPEKSRKDALRRLNELQRRGIDSYVIPSGNLENGVSLGMFSNKTLADNMFEKVKALGYAPKIVTVPREQKEIWAFLLAGEAAKLSDERWAELLSSEEYLQKRQNVCSDLASY